MKTKYKQLNDYIYSKEIPYHNYWETMHLKRIILGEYDNETYFNKNLTGGFITILLGVKTK